MPTLGREGVSSHDLKGAIVSNFHEEVPFDDEVPIDVLVVGVEDDPVPDAILF